MAVILKYGNNKKSVEMMFDGDQFKKGLIELSKEKPLDMAFDELCSVIIKRYRNQ